MISECKVGGVVLFRRNYDTYEEMLELINSLKEANKEKVPIKEAKNTLICLSFIVFITEV